MGANLQGGISIQQVVRDPGFHQLDPVSQAQVLTEVDASFSKLDPESQSQVLNELTGQYQAEANPINQAVDAVGNAYNQTIAKPLAYADAAVAGVTDPFLSAANLGAGDAATRLLTGTDPHQAAIQMYAQQEKAMGLPAGSLTGLYQNPVSNFVGAGVGMVNPLQGAEKLAAGGLRAGAEALYPVAQRTNYLRSYLYSKLFTPLGETKLLGRMAQGAGAFGAYEGVRGGLEDIAQNGLNAASNFGAAAQGAVTGAALGAVGVPAIESAGKLIGTGYNAAKGLLTGGVNAFDSPVGMGALAQDATEAMASKAQMVLEDARRVLTDVQAGTAEIPEQATRTLSNFVQKMEQAAYGVSDTPVETLAQYGETLLANVRKTAKGRIAPTAPARVALDKVIQAAQEGRLKLTDREVLDVTRANDAIRTGKVKPGSAAEKAIEKKLAKVEKRIVEPEPPAAETATTEARPVDAPETIQAKIEQTRQVNEQLAANKEARAAVEAQLEAMPKGSKTPEAKALRDEIVALKAEAKVIREQAPKDADGKPDENITAIAKTEHDFEAGTGKQYEVDPQTQLTYDEIIPYIDPAYKKQADMLDEAMQADQKVRLEYVAEHVGRSREAVKSTAAGNVKEAVTDFTPTHWVLTKDNKVMVGGYNQRGHELTYHVDLSSKGSEIKRVLKIKDEAGFRGAMPNRYLGAREYQLADVLNRPSRLADDTGFLLTSDAKEGFKLLAEFFKPENFNQLPKPLQKILSGVRKRGRLEPGEWAKIRELLQKQKDVQDVFCNIMGL